MSRRDSTGRRPTFGIVFPGDMGAAFGRLLQSGGFPVVTTLEGRSERTARACGEAGLAVLDSLGDVVAAADTVVSLVPPQAAVEVAERFADLAIEFGRAPMYVDANSVSPSTLGAVERHIERAGAALVDASIHGLASRIAAHGTLYLSGPAAGKLAEDWKGLIRIRCLGDRLGLASLQKMLLAGMSKGLVALFVEMALVARHSELLPEFLDETRRHYPAVMEMMDRLLPTVPRHARRRGAEMEELETMTERLGLRPGLIAECRRLYTELGRSDLEQRAESLPACQGLEAVLEFIGGSEPLAPHAAGQPVASTTHCHH